MLAGFFRGLYPMSTRKMIQKLSLDPQTNKPKQPPAPPQHQQSVSVGSSTAVAVRPPGICWLWLKQPSYGWPWVKKWSPRNLSCQLFLIFPFTNKVFRHPVWTVAIEANLNRKRRMTRCNDVFSILWQVFEAKESWWVVWGSQQIVIECYRMLYTIDPTDHPPHP